MNQRAAALIALICTSLTLLVPAEPAAALGMPPTGWLHEDNSEFGYAKLVATADGLLIYRPAYSALQRIRYPGETTVVATGVDTYDLAWDPATDDAIVASLGQLVRIHPDGSRTVVAQTGNMAVLGLAADRDGNLYFSHGELVERVEPDGTRTVVASGLGQPSALAIEPDGDLLVANLGVLLRITDDGMEHVAGAGGPCHHASPCGDGGPARDAQLTGISDLDVGPDGSIYFSDYGAARVRVIRRDGIVHNVAGSYESCRKVERYDCIPDVAATSAIQPVVSIAYLNNNLYIVDTNDFGRWTRLLRVFRATEAMPVAAQGYRMIASDGGVFTFGWSPFHGSTGDLSLVSPIVAGRSNGADGYWFVAGDGGVFTFGDAEYFGSASGRTTSPVVDIEIADDGAGYWVLERDGTVHRFGSAGPLAEVEEDRPPYAAIVQPQGKGAWLVGERPSRLPQLNQPIVAASPTRSGNGIWMVARDGGVFTLGDARFFGSTGAMRLNQPVLDLIPTPTEQGYWLVAADGGVFTFGDAEFFGSMGAVRLNRPVVAGVAGSVTSG